MKAKFENEQVFFTFLVIVNLFFLDRTLIFGVIIVLCGMFDITSVFPQILWFWFFFLIFDDLPK